VISCYVSVGSNIEKEIQLPSGLLSLRKIFGELQISSVYESAAVGFSGENFHNLIVGFESRLSAFDVVAQLKQIELQHGRPVDAKKFSSRKLDLDLILYGDQVIEALNIPRKEIESCAFVLQPLAEIAADSLHPLIKQRYATLWENFDKAKLQQKQIQAGWLNDLFNLSGKTEQQMSSNKEAG
jgi:2-amino-4-hydroxy-6-hydroxymethyldihydropteridine diphosphokinase